MNENAPKYDIEAVCGVLEVKTISQCRLLCSGHGYPYIHYLNGPAVLSSCASLNLGDVSLSCFRSYAHCHGLTKAILFSSPD